MPSGDVAAPDGTSRRWWRGYQRSWLRWDLLAGLTVAAYLVPQVMAYARLAGLDPVVGLWAVLPALAVYAFVGSSPQLSVGPESTTALMTAAAIAPLAAGDPGRYAVLAATLALAVGLLAVLAWALRLGVLAELLSTPILIGYMAGVAVIMVVGQLGRLTGAPVDGSTLFDEVRSTLTHLGDAHPPTVWLALATLVLLFAADRFVPHLPGPLLAVLLATLATSVLGLQDRGVHVVGDIPGGFPTPALPQLADLQLLALPAVGVLLVGYTDNVLTARAFGRRAGHPIDANRELLALGAANAGTGLLQGFPVSSSGSRTALGVAAGARTQVYSLAALAAVVLVLVALRPLLAAFPDAALGAIVVFAATKLVDLAGFRRLRRFRFSELALALAALVGVLVVGILPGVLVAIGLSVAELLRRVARPHDAREGVVPGLAGMHDIRDYPQAAQVPGMVVYRYDSPLFFANAEDFRRRALLAADEAGPGLRWFALNVEANVEVDITALDALEDLRAELEKRGVVLALARVKQDLLVSLRAYGLAERIGEDRMYPTLPTTLEAYAAWSREHPPTG